MHTVSEDTWDRLRETEVEVSLVKDSHISSKDMSISFEAKMVRWSLSISNQKRSLTFLVNERRWTATAVNLEVYAHIIEGRTGHKISKMHLYYTGEDDSNPYITFDKDARSIDQTMEVFDGVVERIENKDFEIASRPDRLCRNCDMKAYCDAK